MSLPIQIQVGKVAKTLQILVYFLIFSKFPANLFLSAVSVPKKDDRFAFSGKSPESLALSRV
jgi:hypothetical protein